MIGNRSNLRHYFIIVACAMVAFCFVNPFHKIAELRYIAWDGLGYYLYLPAFIIYKDPLQLNFAYDILTRYDLTAYFYQGLNIENGNYVLSYTMGTAIMELPFFLVAHAFANIFGFAVDGFSLPYQIAILVAGVTYTLLGLFVLFNLLTKYFSKTSSLIAVLAIMLGTNLYNYGFAETNMSHCYTFFLMCSLLFVTDKFYESPTYRLALLVGLCFGMMLLIRPTVIVAGLLILFWKVNSMNGLVNNIRHWFINYRYTLVALIIGLIPFGLQMLYWNYATGKFLFNSYAYTGQYFEFTNPHLFKGLLSIRKGWLVYTPLAALLLFSFFIRHKWSKLYPAFIIYLLVNVYVVFSWYQWEYGGGFSARALVESYAVLAFPFTGMIEKLKGKFMMWMFGVIIALISLLNLFQTWQYQHDVFPITGTRYEYVQMLGKYERDFIRDKTMLDASALMKKEFVSGQKVLADTIYSDANDSINEPLLSTVNENQFVNAFNGTFGELKLHSNQRIRYTVVAKYGYRDPFVGNWGRLVFSFERDGKPYFQKYLPIDRNATRTFVTTIFELNVPPDFEPNDIVNCFVWNPYSTPLYIKSQKVELLDFR